MIIDDRKICCGNNTSTVRNSSRKGRDEAVKFTGDFESFLKDLGTMVYKTKKIVKHNEHLLNAHPTTKNPINRLNSRRNENLINTQKAALGDMLMMKLVSYYEDKYKLTRHDSTTTKSIISQAFTSPDTSATATQLEQSNIFINNIRRHFDDEPIISDVLVL